MEKKYEITVQVGGYRKEREEEIRRLCMVEWNFREEDFVYVKVPGVRRRLLEMSALGVLYDGENLQEIIERIERAVWRANEGMCHVDIKAVCLGDKGIHPTMIPMEEELLAG